MSRVGLHGSAVILAMTCRSMLMVMPGHFFPQPSLLANQEPVRHLHQRHMVVPPVPGSAFEVIHTDLPFCLRKYFFDAMPLTGPAHSGGQT